MFVVVRLEGFARGLRFREPPVATATQQMFPELLANFNKKQT